MITVDEIVGLLRSRNYPVDFKELQIGNSFRVKLWNGYCLKILYDLGTGEYRACLNHKSIRLTTWKNIDVSSLTIALNHAESLSRGVLDNSAKPVHKTVVEPIQQTVIEPAPQAVVEPVQQASIAHGSDAMPMVVTAFAISFATVILSIGIVSVKFKTCNVNIPQPQHSTVKGR